MPVTPEIVRARPSAALRPYVREYVGWWDDTPARICRREPPGDIVPLIINFGTPVRIYSNDARSAWTDYASFTTGLYDRHVLVETAPASGGLQVNLTIPGARLVLGRPMGELLNTAVDLSDLLGREAETLAERLFEEREWQQRFTIVERELGRRVVAAQAPSAAVMHATSRLLETCGRIEVGRLVGEVGVSQKHLIQRFRQELGVTPKVLARVLRFGRAVEQMKLGRDRLLDVALECGYYDQAHFDRDFREFAGVTPTEFAQVNFVQDGAAADR